MEAREEVVTGEIERDIIERVQQMRIGQTDKDIEGIEGVEEDEKGRPGKEGKKRERGGKVEKRLGKTRIV